MAVDMSMPILMVDDYKTMLWIIRNLLKQYGFDHIDEASDGADALSKFRQKTYGLVLSDWNMEPMTGLQLVQEIRSDADPVKRNVPFIMITAEATKENVEQARKAGVNNYIIKPFNAETLKNKLCAVIGDF